MSSHKHFQGKRIAVIGLGPHGEMIADIRFLVKAGALVSVYDLSSTARVQEYMSFLSAVGLAAYQCGSIPVEDLSDMDLILLSREYSRDSTFLSHIKGTKIDIEYPETLFFKLAPPVTVVGIMGACGKSTVLSMLAPMLESVAKSNIENKRSVYIIDPESDEGVVSHLAKIKSNDVVIVRMDNSLMQDMFNLRMSPHIAIFTTIPPNGSYSESPFEILSYQTYNNFIVAPSNVIDATYNHKFQPKAKMLRTKPTIVPNDWPIMGRGMHDRENASLALEAARIFKIQDETARNLLSKWKPIKGRLELIKKVRGIEYYNDTAAVSPYATITGICSLGEEKNIVLIFGGAENKSDFRELYAVIPRHVKTLIVVPGSGTLRERKTLRTLHDVEVISSPSIEESVRIAAETAKKGDKVLFSPGFEAGGIDRSRKERGERFVRSVRSL